MTESTGYKLKPGQCRFNFALQFLDFFAVMLPNPPEGLGSAACRLAAINVCPEGIDVAARDLAKRKSRLFTFQRGVKMYSAPRQSVFEGVLKCISGVGEVYSAPPQNVF